MKKKYVNILKFGKMLATDIAKMQGYDLRTTKGKKRVNQILKKGVYKTKPSKISYKKLAIIFNKEFKNFKAIKKTSLYNNLYKKYKFDSDYSKVSAKLKEFEKSKKLKKISKGLTDSWDGNIGSNLKKYIDRFTFDERRLFNKIIGKMSDKEIESRFGKYATMYDINDLKYLYYPNSAVTKKKTKDGTKYIIKDTADDMLAVDSWRLDTLKKYSDIFLKTAKNENEYNKILKIFDEIAKKHEEIYEE